MIAISKSSCEEFGCVACEAEHLDMYEKFSENGTTLVKCRICGEEFMVLTDGLTKSTIGLPVSCVSDVVVYPILVEHPKANEIARTYK